MEGTQTIVYTGELPGLKSRASHYHRYLEPNGGLTPFQVKKLEERRAKKALQSNLPVYTARVDLSVAEEIQLNAMVKDLTVDSKGFYTDPQIVDRFSLRMLYRCRCRQLQVKIDPLVDLQLAPASEPEWTDRVLHLDFRRTYLGPQGVLALASVVVFCQELQSLVLCGVGIKAVQGSSQHFTSLMTALQSCGRLELLDLSSNTIQDFFGSVVVSAVQSHPYLVDVNLTKSGLCELVVRKVQHIVGERIQQRIA